MYFYVSVLYLYTVSVNQALCSMLVAATGPLLLILLNKAGDIYRMPGRTTHGVIRASISVPLNWMRSRTTWQRNRTKSDGERRASLGRSWHIERLVRVCSVFTMIVFVREGYGACRDSNGVRTVSGRVPYVRRHRPGAVLGRRVDVPCPAGVPHPRLETSSADHHAAGYHHCRSHLVSPWLINPSLQYSVVKL